MKTIMNLIQFQNNLDKLNNLEIVLHHSYK